ncbi:MAG: class I SAM-dependent methyltransferase [Deltaproteobacteria bacterium]|nr:class I SAM-dependent methyltransferase [Deltaproteobacteria bacterium]
MSLAESIDQLVGGYVPAMVLFAALDLELFDALDETMPIATLASRLATTEDGLARLCRALATMGFVTFDGASVSAVPEARALLAKAGPASLASVVHHHRFQLLPPLLQLSDAVRTGRPQHAAWPFARQPIAATPYEELARHPEEVRALVIAMDHGSVGVGAAIARTLDLSAVRLLVDIGCGGGVVARELLRALPELRIYGVDSEPAVAVARERSAAEGLTARHTIEPGDARRGVPVQDADVVMFSAILADFPRDERIEILRHARRVLRPGGIVVISETLFDDDRRGPARPALLSLVLLAVTSGDQLAGDQLGRELVAAGFSPPTIHRGPPRDLVVAARST